MERISVNLKKSRDDSYEIFIGLGVMDRLGTMMEAQNQADGHFIITDANVNPLYGHLVKEKLKEAALPTEVIEIPAGEPSKSMSTVLDVVKQLLALKASRRSLLIALGGGRGG